MSEVTFNNQVRSAFDNVTKQALVCALAIVATPKDKLTDNADKKLWIRAERTIHNACEALDGASYRTMGEILNKSKAYKEAQATLRGKAVVSSSIAPSGTK